MTKIGTGNVIGIRFLVKGGHQIDAAVTEQEAEKINDAWRSDITPKPKVSAYDRTFDRFWAVDLGEVQGIISFDPNKALTLLKQASQQSFQQTESPLSQNFPPLTLTKNSPLFGNNSGL